MLLLLWLVTWPIRLAVGLGLFWMWLWLYSFSTGGWILQA